MWSSSSTTYSNFHWTNWNSPLTDLEYIYLNLTVSYCSFKHKNHFHNAIHPITFFFHPLTKFLLLIPYPTYFFIIKKTYFRTSMNVSHASCKLLKCFLTYYTTHHVDPTKLKPCAVSSRILQTLHGLNHLLTMTSVLYYHKNSLCLKRD